LEEQGSPYTPLGYAAPAAMPAYVAAPSPVQAPSMVSNVTVTQVTPPTPVPTTPPVVTEGDGGSLSVALRALYFLLSGIVAGLAWVAAAASNEPRTFLFAATMTILVLVLDIAILTRNHRR
jgi:predicted phage tail protein